MPDFVPILQPVLLVPVFMNGELPLSLHILLALSNTIPILVKSVLLDVMLSCPGLQLSDFPPFGQLVAKLPYMATYEMPKPENGLIFSWII